MVKTSSHLVWPVLSDSIPKTGEEMTERIMGSVDTKPDIVASMPLFCRMVGTKLKIASSTMLKAAKPQKKSTVSLVKTLPSVGL